MTNPTLITTPFAENGDKNIIPESVGANPQNATMQAGFPPITQQKISEGGIPPERNDFNGILNLYGQHIVHLNKGLPYEFDQAFADAIGGYPLNARLMLANGDIVQSTIANNVNNPNSNMNGWILSKNNKVISSIEDLLSINNPKNNDVVFVKSYYANANKGGGVFYFDNSKSSTNDGVLVFNGWVRDLSNKILTTDDAGLIDNDGSNATEKFKIIASILSNTSDFNFYVFGKHLVNTNIEILNSKNLRIMGKGWISAKELRSTWSFSQPSGVRGVLYFKDCPYLTVTNHLQITGSKKQNFNAPEIFEDGDCPIQLVNCPYSLIESCEFNYSIAWGILAENSSYTIVKNNDIYDVVRQSGVNIVVGGGTKCKVINNRIHDIGLYGVEWETAQICEDFEQYGNIIWNCQKGTALINKVVNGNIHDNIIKFCNEGVTAYPLTVANESKGIVVQNNNIYGTVLGMHSTSSLNVVFKNNLASMKIVGDFYYIKSSYNSVMEILSNTEILVLPQSNITPSSQVKINNQILIVSSVVSIPDNRWGTTNMKKITFNSAITTVSDGDFILSYTPFGDQFRGMFSGGGNNNILFKDNTIIGYYSAIQSDSSYTTADNQEMFFGNTIIDCTRWLTLYFATIGVNISNTIRSNSDGIVANNNALPYIKPTSSKIVENTTARSGTGSNPTQFFTSRKTQFLGCIISFDASLSTTGNVVIKIDGVDSYTIPNGATLAANKSFISYGIKSISEGAHSVQVVDTVGDLKYSKWSIEFMED